MGCLRILAVLTYAHRDPRPRLSPLDCEPVRQRALTRVACDQRPAAGACRNAPSVAPLLGADLLTMPQAAARAKDELGNYAVPPLRKPAAAHTSG